MYYVGCDQHKHYSLVIAKDKNGVMKEHKKLYHTQREEMVDFYSSLPEGSTVAIEASGFGFWQCDLLQELGINVKLTNPAKTRAIAEEKIKTDKLSANILSDLLRADILAESYLAPPDVREQRLTIRYRMSLVRLRTQLKNKVHALLDQLGHIPPFTDLFGKAGRKYLAQLSLSRAYQETLDGYLHTIDELNTLISESEISLRKQVKDKPVIKLLMTMPGVGVILASCIASEIGDINRFMSSSKLASYIGFIPSLHQSGKLNRYGTITKQGNKYLRWAFVEAAHTAVRRDPYLARHYAKLRAHKGTQVAIVAIARKLAVYAYQILKKQQPYEYKNVYNGQIPG